MLGSAVPNHTAAGPAFAIANLVIRLGVDAGRSRLSAHDVATATAATIAVAAIAHESFDCVVTGLGASCRGASTIQRSSRARSSADCQRASGSLARQVFTTRSSAAGVIG